MRKLGRREWVAYSGYSRRSLAAKTAFRCKAILGHQMRGRSFSNQQAEVDLGCKILNTMTRSGMPQSICVR